MGEFPPVVANENKTDEGVGLPGDGNLRRSDFDYFRLFQS